MGLFLPDAGCRARLDRGEVNQIRNRKRARWQRAGVKPPAWKERGVESFPFRGKPLASVVVARQGLRIETIMYFFIIAIGWLYVTLLMALTEPNWIASILSFFFYGLAPCALFLYLFRPRKKRDRRDGAPEKKD
jgi:hypothetical protein